MYSSAQHQAVKSILADKRGSKSPMLTASSRSPRRHHGLLAHPLADRRSGRLPSLSRFRYASAAARDHAATGPVNRSGAPGSALGTAGPEAGAAPPSPGGARSPSRASRQHTPRQQPNCAFDAIALPARLQNVFQPDTCTIISDFASECFLTSTDFHILFYSRCPSSTL